MSQTLQIIDELEVALKSNSTERHHAILKSVTGLFLAGCDRMTEDITSLFDDVIVRLVDHVESRARVELSPHCGGRGIYLKRAIAIEEAPERRKKPRR